VSSVAYNATMYRVNPGDPTTFPWLRNVAVNYQQYELKGMLVEFKSTSATAVASTNTALGVVIIGANYNPDEPVFSNKRAIESSMYVSSAAPSQSFVMPIECAASSEVARLKYVRFGTNIPTTASRALYDHCNFTVATQGAQAASVVGELWVTYDVELSKPLLPDPLGEGALQAHIRGNSTTTPSTAPSTGNCFGANPSSVMKATYNTINITVQGNSAYWDSIGTYLVVYTARAGTSYTAGAPLIPWGGTSGTTPATYDFFGYGSFGGPYSSANAGSGTQTYINVIVVNCTLPGQGVAVAAGPTVVGTADFDMVVIQISSNLIAALAPYLGVGRGTVFKDDKKADTIIHDETEEQRLGFERDECNRIVVALKALGIMPSSSQPGPSESKGGSGWFKV